MKRLFLVVTIIVIFIVSLFASQFDSRKALFTNEAIPRPVQQNCRSSAPEYSFAFEPISLVDNYYDYFPGSYTGKPVQRISTPTLDGNWLIYQAKITSDSSRRIYKVFIDNNGTVQANAAFAADDLHEGFPGVAVTEGGRPILAYHVNVDSDPDLETAFGYDAVIGGVALGMNSTLYTIIDNPHELEVNGQIISTNEFIWPSVQIGPSPFAGSQRVYILGKNSEKNGSGVSENVLIYYNDFTEDEIENQTFDNLGWSFTSIPQMNEWNTSHEEWRRPYMSFIAHDDKIYYIGYHIAYTEPTTGTPIHEGTTTAFICDNYGEGTWTQHSIYNEFNIDNPGKIDPHTGASIPGTGIFVDSNSNAYADEFIRVGIGQSANFSTSVDNEGRIHFPVFYVVKNSEGSYWPDFHSVKKIAFDTNTLAWEVAEVYPQLDNGTNTPNPPIDITNYDGANNGTNAGDIWLSWDQDGDGMHDQVYDDGTWDGIDDGITPDSAIWGVPVRDNKWPYMYWDNDAAEGSMMFHLHTAHITDGNELGMMAMIWQDSKKSKNYNEFPDEYPELVAYQNMCELAISVSADNGRHWSAPIFLNGVDNPEMQGQIPEFPYLSNKVDYIGEDPISGYPMGRIYIMYLDDYTYGSSVQDIGQASGGSMQFMAIDVVFSNLPTDNINNDVVPSISMLSQNYPNPFNPETKINFNVIKSGNVELNIYNVKGQLVKTLVNANKTVGSHSVVWQGDDNNGRKVSSGVYFYRVTNGGKSEMKKMVLMK